MIKKLLNKFSKILSLEDDKEFIEKYLSQSSNTYDLDQRIRELDKKNKYIQFYM
tara:strand:- start:10 stop:171 length:162 start_codon:yes stop_codon:yes gene_type:complete